MKSRDHVQLVVIDDKKSFVGSLRQILDAEKYSISSIVPGKDAASYLNDIGNTPDIIFLADQTGGISAVTVLRQIVPVRDDLCFIYISANDCIEPVEEAMDAGAMDFIVPSRISAERLLSKLAKIMKVSRLKAECKRVSKIESENLKLSTVVEQSSAAIVITDLLGNIEYANHQFSVISGYSVEEAIGKNPRILKSDTMPKEYYAELWETIMSGKTWKGEFCNINKQGKIYWEESIITPIINENNEIIRYAAIKHDISARKSAEDKVRLQNIELAKLNEDKNVLISILAHDLKNPFSGFMGLISFLKDNHLRISPEKLQSYFELIHDSAQGTYQLLVDLLNWARSESGKMPFHLQMFNVKEMVEQTEKLFQLQMAKKNIAVEYSVADNLYLFADIDLIKAVLRNFLSNALKFTRPGGNIKVTSSETAIDVTIAVTDDGIGMNEEALSSIFSIAKKTTTPGTENEQGSGFGLIFSKQFIDLHQGQMHVTSTEGEGSTFSFTIPKEII